MMVSRHIHSMMRRRRLLSALLALLSLSAAAQAQQFVAPTAAPSPLPSYLSNVAPAPAAQPPQFGADPTTSSAQGYAVPVGYEAYSPRGGGVVHAAPRQEPGHGA